MEDKFKLWVECILAEFPEISDPRTLDSMNDCKKWFKEYKKAIKGQEHEWDYCKTTLLALGQWETGMTKNQAYLRENSSVINLLYKHYVLW